MREVMHREINTSTAMGQAPGEMSPELPTVKQAVLDVTLSDGRTIRWAMTGGDFCTGTVKTEQGLTSAVRFEFDNPLGLASMTFEAGEEVTPPLRPGDLAKGAKRRA